MSPWDWLALSLIALVVVAGVLVLVYWALRAINASIRKSARAGDEDATRAADRMIVVSQLWMGVGLIVFGASIAVLFGVIFSDRDIDKIALSIGTAVIGTGAALLPAGASASASGRINTSIQKQNGNGGSGQGNGGNGDGATDGTATDLGASDATTTTTTTTTTATDTSGSDATLTGDTTLTGDATITGTTGTGDSDTPPSDIDVPPVDIDLPSAQDVPPQDVPPQDVPEPQDATVPGDTAAGDAQDQPPAGQGDPKK